MIPFKHMPPRPGVYRLTNSATGEFYIGGSSNMRDRCKQHSDGLRNGTHGNRLILESYAKSGHAVFAFDVVEQTSLENVFDLERRWINKLSPLFNSECANRAATKASLDRLAELRDGRRAPYLWNTNLAAAAVGCSSSKFGDWALRTKRKFIELYLAQPAETTMEFLSWIAEAESDKADRARKIPQPEPIAS